MKYNYDMKMGYTDNPYIDLLVHYTKIMGLNCVIKNEREALKYETLESRRESNDLIAYKQGIPLNYDFYEDVYVEKNNYYRKLNGLPPIPTTEEEKIYIDKYGTACIDPLTGHVKELLEYAYIPMSEYQSMVPDDYFLDLTDRFLHQLSPTELKLIDQCGVMDIIKSTYTDSVYDYIYHMGEMKINPYIARTAENFSLLYCPSVPFPEIEEKFKRTYERNRIFTITTIYSEAFTFGSVHYDNFIEILIIIQTMIDLISEVQEYIINKDVFDSRTIRYLFESYGIEYYKEIDVKYQLRIIKNINRLLKYKSTNINITDIVEIFDNTDIDIFTYYLMKTKRVPKEEFKFYTEDDINPKYYPDGKVFYIGSDKTTNNRYPLLEYPTTYTDSSFKGYIRNSLINAVLKHYKIPSYQTSIFKVVRVKIDEYFDKVPSFGGLINYNRYYYKKIKNNLFTLMSGDNILNDTPIPDSIIYEILDNIFNYNSEYVGWIDAGQARMQIPNDKETVEINMEVVVKSTIPVYNESSIDQIVTEDMVGTENYSENYNLCFVRVPIDEPNASAYMEDMSVRKSYDNITNQDPFWDGVSKADILTEEEKARYHEEKKKEILSKDFTVERTKYLSVDASIDNTKMSYQLSYFMNILTDNHIDEELLMLEVNPILSSDKVKLNDLFAFATALNYLYNGVEPDNITSSMENNMTINGFNFDTDWNAIFQELNDRMYIYNNELQKMNKGYLVELDSDYPGAFLSGRYSACSCSDKNGIEYGYSVIWESMKHYKVIDIFEGYSDYTFDGWNGYSYPSYLESVLSSSDPIYNENMFGVDEDTGYMYHLIDITWDTPYDPEQNSHANFMNTDILNTMNNDSYSDLEKFNKLKEIYYTNTNLYDHLVYMMKTSENKRMYDIYHTLFESFMETKLSTDIFKVKDTSGNIIYEDIYGNVYKYSIVNEHYETDSNGNKIYYDVNGNRYEYRVVNDIPEYYGNGVSIPLFKDSMGEYIQDSDGSYIPDSSDLKPLYQYDTVYMCTTDSSLQIPAIYDEDTKTYVPSNMTGLFPRTATSYYEYLQNRNVDLYNHLMDVSNSYKNIDEQKTAITTLCSYISEALQDYFDSAEWKFIYNIIPSYNLEFIQQCILKVVMFFKSWKTQMLDQTVSYIMDDSLGNYVHILDDLYMNSSKKLHDKIFGDNGYHDFINSISYRDIVSPLDKVDISTTMYLYVGTEEDFIYYINNDEVTLVRYIGTHTALQIPTRLEGYPVIKMDEPTFSYRDDVTYVVIPNGIKYIE